MTVKEMFLKKIFLIPAIIIALYTLVGFFLVPFIGTHTIKNSLGKSLNRTISIEKLAVNPYALTATIDGLDVTDTDNQAFFSARRIYANISLFSLFVLAPEVSQICLENPRVNIVRNKDATFNFSDLLALNQGQEKRDSQTDGQDKSPMEFTLKDVRITQGELMFEDRVTGVSHSMTDFELTLPLLSTREKSLNTPATLDIDFVANQAKVAVHLESTPFAADLATRVDVRTSDVDVVHYLPYLPIPETIRLKDLGLNLDLHAAYLSNPSGPSLVLQGKVAAVNAALNGAAGEKIITFPSLTLDLSPSDLLAGQLNIAKILMQTPQLNLTRDPSGTLNLLTYVTQTPAPPEPEAPQPQGNKSIDQGQGNFSLNLVDLEIKNAAVSFHDLSNDQPFETLISPVNLRVEKLKAGKTISGQYRLALATEAKERVESSGRFQTHPVQAQGSLNLSDLVLNKYFPYYGSLVLFDVNDGTATLSTDYEVSEAPDNLDVKISALDFMVQTLVIADRNARQEMVNIPEFNIKGAVIDVGTREINTGTITTHDAKILVQRDQAGGLNLFQGVAPAPAANVPATPEMTAQNQPSVAEAPPWSITMPLFDATGMNIRFNDLTGIEPVAIDLSKISIKAGNVKTTGDEQATLAVEMNWQQQGSIRISGSVVPSTLRAGFDVDLEKIDVKSLQPYFTDILKIQVTDGSVSTKGKLDMNLGAPPANTIQFAGETSLNNFVTLDKQTKKEFFKCSSLYLSGLDLALFPVKVTIKDISLTDFYSRIFINDTGETNLASLLNKDAAQNIESKPEQKPAEKKAEPPQIRVENVTLQGGHISFSDYFNQPNFNAGMKEIAGSLTGLSSDEKSRAKLVLKGVYGVSSPLDIVGTINPLAQKKFADVAISFKDIELSNFTPYSSRYIGYKIEKGKLVLDLEYTIDGNALKSSNRVRLDNLSLGDQVPGKKPINLPLGLAISLLKNRDGQINLDVPVTGALDDPKFEIGTIVLNTLKNLIVKVVTSPFSVIGAMFGGGEELGYVDFEYGESAIAEDDHEKLNKLAEILKEKPGIKFEIKGVYDALRDAESLGVKQFEDAVRVASQKELTASGVAGATTEQAEIQQPAMDRYIFEAYAQAQFPKPRDEAGNEKELDLEEKKKLLMTNIDVKKDDLRLLAMTRSANIKGYLISTGKVEKERIFLLEPTEVDSSTTQQTNRVKFSLK